MKKIFLSILLFVLVQSGYAQLSKKMAKDTLIWRQDSSLSKESFKAKHQSGYPFAAYTCATLFFYAKDRDGELKFCIEAIFLKSKSFFMKEVSPYLLNHEQIHFDIVELYARKMRQRLAEKDFKKINNIRGEIQKQYDKAISELNKEQDKYDKDTEHGMNSAKQQVWNESIAAQLKELDKYASTEIDVANK
jgi:hypothetical protein